MDQELYESTGFDSSTSDFWKVNREAIQSGVDQRKTFVLSTDLETILMKPEKATYSEVQLILHPGNNYVVVTGGEYDMLIPAEQISP
jgi:hypothetical protein